MPHPEVHDPGLKVFPDANLLDTATSPASRVVTDINRELIVARGLGGYRPGLIRETLLEGIKPSPSYAKHELLKGAYESDICFAMVLHEWFLACNAGTYGAICGNQDGISVVLSPAFVSRFAEDFILPVPVYPLPWAEKHVARQKVEMAKMYAALSPQSREILDRFTVEEIARDISEDELIARDFVPAEADGIRSVGAYVAARFHVAEMVRDDIAACGLALPVFHWTGRQYNFEQIEAPLRDDDRFEGWEKIAVVRRLLGGEAPATILTIGTGNAFDELLRSRLGSKVLKPGQDENSGEEADIIYFSAKTDESFRQFEELARHSKTNPPTIFDATACDSSHNWYHDNAALYRYEASDGSCFMNAVIMG